MTFDMNADINLHGIKPNAKEGMETLNFKVSVTYSAARVLSIETYDVYSVM